MPTCFCSRCESKDFATVKTLLAHVKKDEEIYYRQNATPRLREYLKGCIQDTKASIDDYNKGLSSQLQLVEPTLPRATAITSWQTALSNVDIPDPTPSLLAPVSAPPIPVHPEAGACHENKECDVFNMISMLDSQSDNEDMSSGSISEDEDITQYQSQGHYIEQNVDDLNAEFYQEDDGDITELSDLDPITTPGSSRSSTNVSVLPPPNGRPLNALAPIYTELLDGYECPKDPPETYHGNVIINLATPGPNSPGDIESFLFPLFQEMAAASEGLWLWDAIDSSYFVNRAYITMALGDMLGSAKLNGMAGHTAIFGDRFSLVQSARANNTPGSKSLYYPMNPPDNSCLNPSRPPSYDLANIPMRNEKHYWNTILELNSAQSKAERARITKRTGVSRLPLCAHSQAFMHPTFFPLDPFHLFYENCMAHIWDIWTVHSNTSERVHLSATKAKKLGELVAGAMKTLPPAFCGPVRDPYLKRQSQYKVYEWMALLHWYILPIGIDIGMDASVLSNFAEFSTAVEFSMTIQARSENDIASLHATIRKFLTGFEAIYVNNQPSSISRCRLCIFQLIHVPVHIKWNGSIRIGSQATVERSIGEVGHRIRSKKAPFANLSSIIIEKELLRVLGLYYPSLFSPLLPSSGSLQQNSTVEPIEPSPAASLSQPKFKLVSHLPIRKAEHISSAIARERHIVLSYIQISDDSDVILTRWGKCKLPNNRVLRSKIADEKSTGNASRQYRWFEARDRDNQTTIFGEALSFYLVKNSNDMVGTSIVVYRKLDNLSRPLGQIRGIWDDSNIYALHISCLMDIVGIWQSQHSGHTYILRKHPALAMLNAEELGLSTVEDGEEILSDNENDESVF